LRRGTPGCPNIAAGLIRRGIDQRNVAGILEMIRMLGANVGASDRTHQLVNTLEARLADA
jgi:ABC-type hemin transport system substrate-binding protein